MGPHTKRLMFRVKPNHHQKKELSKLGLSEPGDSLNLNKSNTKLRPERHTIRVCGVSGIRFTIRMFSNKMIYTVVNGALSINERNHYHIVGDFEVITREYSSLSHLTADELYCRINECKRRQRGCKFLSRTDMKLANIIIRSSKEISMIKQGNGVRV